MIQAKFGLNWLSGFRGEDFWKSLQTDDKSSHRWAKKQVNLANINSFNTFHGRIML
jgi:hypothetical protein